MKRTAIFSAFLFVAMANAMASQPLRRTVTRQLADGSMVSVERRGDAAFSWWQTADGKRYEMSSDRKLRPLTHYAEALATGHSGATPAPRNAPHKAMSASTVDGLGEYGTSGLGVVNSLGSPLIPVIMVAFSDKDFLPENTKEKIDRFLNEEGYHDEKYAVGSVADYFEHSSYGAFRPRFEVVAKVTLPNDYKYYGAHAGSSTDSRRMEVVNDAVHLAEEQGVNFSKFASGSHAPLISILHAGPGEQEDYGDDYGDYLWAHFSQSTVSAKSTTFNSYLMSNETMRDFDQTGKVVTSEYMTGIGTFCHEFGHALGLPDMYDVNGESNGAGHTPGYWDVMDYQFMYDGFRPMEYSGYERSMMGWLSVTDIDASMTSVPQTIAALGSDEMVPHQLYRIVCPGNPGEYFLLENRQKNLFYQDTFLGTGMLLWHIYYDSAKWSSNIVNVNASQQRVSVVPADGAWQSNADVNKRDALNQRYTFPGDLFPGYAKVTTFDSRLRDFYCGTFENSVTNIANTGGLVTFTYVDRKTVGVDAVEMEDAIATEGADAPVYDLSGRYLTGTPANGLYIKNGKTTLIRR